MLRILPYVVVLPLAFVHFLSQTPTARYFGDESGWVRSSISVANFVASGDFKPRSWNADSDGPFGQLNPQLGKLAFAVPILAEMIWTGKPAPEPPLIFRHHHGYRENVAWGRVASPDLRAKMQRVSVFFGTLLCGICMLLVHRVSNALGALVAGFLIALNDNVTALSSTVLTDMMYQALVFATVLAAIWACQPATPRAATRRLLVVAVLLALATAVKYAAALLLAPVVLCVLALQYHHEKVTARAAAGRVAAFLAVAGGLTILLNPFFWPDFTEYDTAGLGREWRLLRHGEFRVGPGGEMPEWVDRLYLTPDLVAPNDDANDARQYRLTEFEHAVLRSHLWRNLVSSHNRIDPLHVRSILPRMYELSRPIQFPVVFLRWRTIRQQMATKDFAVWPSNAGFCRFLTTERAPIPGTFPLALIAIGILLWPETRGVPHTLHPRRLLLLFGLTLLAMIYATRIADNDRYLVAVYLLRVMFASVTIAHVTGVSARAFRNYRARRSG